jgi:hypothetical protein
VEELIGPFLAVRYDEAEAAARDLLRTARDARQAVREPRMLGREIPGWHSWPDVEAMCSGRLADIGLKRAILALHSASIAKRDGYPFSPWTGRPQPEEHDGDCGLCGWFAPEEGGCLTARHLAGEFAGHPEFKPGWAAPDAT